MNEYKIKQADTKLEKAVKAIINRHAADYETGCLGFYKDLRYGGCQSGMVGELIYYHDTIKFYKRHRAEIYQMLTSDCRELACTPAEMFSRSNWDTDDPLALETTNQNLLAWYGFEEVARRLMERDYPRCADE